MDAARALADLTEISSQIEAAVVLDGDGSLLGSTLSGEAKGSELADLARELQAAAERAAESGKPLAQLEVATTEGSVFLVRDGERMIAATTSPEPTVGLVFYDLKSCLRSLGSEEEKPKRRTRKQAENGGAGGNGAA